VDAAEFRFRQRRQQLTAFALLWFNATPGFTAGVALFMRRNPFASGCIA
jgi:hypothetical protein